MNRKGVPASLFSLDGCCRTCYRDDHTTAEHAEWEARHDVCVNNHYHPKGEECPCIAIARESREREIREKNRKEAARHARAKERMIARRAARGIAQEV